MSSARGAVVGAGIDVVDDQGVVVEDGQGVGGGRYSEGGVCPGVVWGRALLNLA